MGAHSTHTARWFATVSLEGRGGTCQEGQRPLCSPERSWGSRQQPWQLQTPEPAGAMKLVLWLGVTHAVKIPLRQVKLQDSLYIQVTPPLLWKCGVHTRSGTTSMSCNNWIHPAPPPRPQHGAFHSSGKFFHASSQSSPTLQATSAWISIAVHSLRLSLDFTEIELYGCIILGPSSFA